MVVPTTQTLPQPQRTFDRRRKTVTTPPTPENARRTKAQPTANAIRKRHQRATADTYATTIRTATDQPTIDVVMQPRSRYAGTHALRAPTPRHRVLRSVMLYGATRIVIRAIRRHRRYHAPRRPTRRAGYAGRRCCARICHANTE